MSNAETALANSQRTPARKKRTTFEAPQQIHDTMSLYDYLAACNPPMAEKLIDIALAAYNAPRQLRDEIAQEIRIAWVVRKPDHTRFEPAQIAAYAYRIAYHTTLKSWREMGSPVRLPGSAFRKRADGSTYVTPGLLAAPLEWSEMDNWFRTDDLPDFDGQAAHTAHHPAALDANGDEVPEGEEPIDEEDELIRRRQDFLDEHRGPCSVTDLEYDTLSLLIAGHDCDRIQDTLRLKRGQLHKLLESAAAKLPETP